MPDANAEIELTTTELSAGAIKSVSLPGEGGTTRIVQVRIPPGVEDGSLLRVPAPGGEVYIRITATPTPTAAPTDTPTAPPGSAAPTSPPPTFSFPPTSSFSPGWAASPPARPRPAYGSQARSRRKVMLFTGIAAAVVVLVVALITANAGGNPGGSTGRTSQQAAPAEPTTTTPPPESAADYQQALNTLAVAWNTGLTALNNAQTPSAIATAATDLGNGIQQAASAFGAVPPTDATTANAALVSALQDFTGTDIGSINDAATSDEVCLGPAATALLSRADSLNELRAAITTLTSGGLTYQFGGALPPVTQDGARAAGNGSVVAGGVKHGLGELTITNGGDTDATVGLVAGGGAPLVTVYVGHGASYTLHHVPDGTYTIYVTSGDDWDATARLFSRNCEFQQFDQTMDFTTTSSEYTTYTITLTPVPDGNATESDVDPGAFPH